MIDNDFPKALGRYLSDPDEKLYRTSKDPVERPLGSVIGRGLWEYAQSRVVLLGCPQDEGVRRNGGRPGARLAPTEIRRWLFKYPAPEPISDADLCDLGDLAVNSSLEEMHRAQRAIVRALIEDGKRVIVLGGGNDISYPDVSALSDIEPEVAALNVDSHFDIRANDIRHSGTPYRQLLDEGRITPDEFYVIGCKPEVNAPEYTRYLEKIGANIIWLGDLRDNSLDKVLRGLRDSINSKAIFWGLDFDVVRSSDAPGVSMTYPVGLTAEEICTIAAAAGSDPRTRVLELSEVNPEQDIDHRTSRLAAQAIMHFLSNLEPPPTPPE